MKTWKYAILSYLAKLNGGPEKFVEKLFKAGFDKGYKLGYSKGYVKGARDTLIICGVLFLIHFSYKKYIKKVLKEISNIPSEDIEKEKNILINGIKNYEQTI